MRLHHYGILAATILLLGVLIGYSFLKTNKVPVAMVNGDVITLGEVKENAEVASRLYEQAPELVSAQDGELASLFKARDSKALFARALESSIVLSIMRSQASQETLDEAERLSLRSVEEARMRSLSAVLRKQYGWDVNMFKEKVIEPQILRELIADMHGDSFKVWSDNARQTAKVSLWFVPFDWVNGELIEK